MSEPRERKDDAQLEQPARGRAPGVFDLAFLTGVEDVTELLLVRHGQQEVDWRGPVSEMVDPPLSVVGREQARRVGAYLSTLRIDAVYASSLARARDTGAEIARHQGIDEVLIRDDLREVEVFRDIPPDQTALDFMGKDLLDAVRDRMLVEKSWDIYPYSEGSAEFRRRCVNAVEAIIARHPGQRVAIACHGGVINAYVGHIIGSRFDMFFRPAHASVSVCAAGEGRRALHRLNDVHHLLEGDQFHTH
jgi:broad specificity phosphatase PhoE